MIICLGIFFVIVVLFLLLIGINDCNLPIVARERELPTKNEEIKSGDEIIIPKKKCLGMVSVNSKYFLYDKAKALDGVAKKFCQSRGIELDRTVLVSNEQNMYRLVCFDGDNKSEIIFQSGEENGSKIVIEIIFFGPEGLFLEQSSKMGFGDIEVINLYR